MTDWLLPALAGFGTGILSAWGVGGGTLPLLPKTLPLDADQTPLGTRAALAAAWAATSGDITVFRKPFGVFLLWAGANMLLQKKK